MQKNFNIEELEKVNKNLSAKLNELNGRQSLLNEQINNANNKLAELTHNKEIFTKEVEVLTVVQEMTRNKIKEGFENIVSYALRSVFNQDYKFILNFDKRGNLSELDFNIFAPERTEAGDPLDSSGGGVLDIASLALRIALLELSKPKIPGMIVLDESFKHVSSAYLANCSKFLTNINKKINRQIILVTHQNNFIEGADNVIDLNEIKEK